MNNDPIGVFDSGIGGLNVLQALERVYKKENFIYLSNISKMPYGNKSATQISRIAEEMIRTLRSLGAKTVVIGCNTASFCYLSKYVCDSFPVVGTFPPIESARNYKFEKILVMGTKVTCEFLRERYGKAVKDLIILPQKELASMVENVIKTNKKTYNAETDSVFNRLYDVEKGEITQKADNLSFSEKVGQNSVVCQSIYENIRRTPSVCSPAFENESKTPSGYLSVSGKTSENLFENMQNAIEENTEFDEYLYKSLICYEGKVDCVALGCTHYYYLAKKIKNILKVPVFDGKIDVIDRLDVVLDSVGRGLDDNRKITYFQK